MERVKMPQQRLINKFYIRNKKGQRVPFVLNKAQADYEKNRTGRDYILKARQIGFTTYEQLRKLEKAMLRKYTNLATIAHKRDKTESIFSIAKFAWDNLPEEVKMLYDVKYDNVREIYFGKTDCRYFVDLDIRSGTVQDLHISEFAMISEIEELFASSLETVPKGGTITLETTANGLNKAHDIWQEAVAGKNEFKAHFYNWTWLDEYQELPPESDTWKEDYKLLAKRYSLIEDIQNIHQLSDAQFYWYYLKAIRLKESIKQEYPTIADEAFLSSSISVFDLFKVSQLQPRSPLRLFKGTQIFHEPINTHRYCIGIDTSEGIGNDNTSIQVFDMTGEKKIEVASFLDDTIRPDQTADVAIELGYLYNTALLMPERNSSGLSTVLKIKEKSYPKLFINRKIDSRTQKISNEYGWRTSGGNRDVMIDDFIDLFENDQIEINSSHIIQQMKTFVRKPNGKREHEEGYNDDALFGCFLAIQGGKFHREAVVTEGIAL